ncbi:hypothetical protein EJB05_31834, partial [Eragrostis curvula]
MLMRLHARQLHPLPRASFHESHGSSSPIRRAGPWCSGQGSSSPPRGPRCAGQGTSGGFPKLQIYSPSSSKSLGGCLGKGKTSGQELGPCSSTRRQQIQNIKAFVDETDNHKKPLVLYET